MKYWTLLLTFILFSCAKDHYIKRSLHSNQLKACFTGDMGSGWKEQNLVAEKLSKEGCDKHFFLGDLIYPHGLKSEKDPQFKEKFLDPYAEILEQGKEFYIVLGNHDHHRDIGAWKKIALERPQIVHPHPFFRVNMDGLCFVIIDSTNLRFYTAFVSGLEQRNWLKEIDPELNRECSMKVMLSHHPYLNRGLNHGPSSGLLKNTQEKFILGHYDYMFSGHEHILSDEGSIKGTRLFVSGAGGKPAKNEDAGYLVVEFIKSDEKWSVRKTEFRKIKNRK